MAATSKGYRTFTISGVKKKLYPTNCSGSPSIAADYAADLRGKGKLARVVKSGKRWCVYTNTPGKKK